MGLQVDDGGAETSQTVGKVGGEFRRDDLVTSTVLWQVLVRLQVKDGCSVATDGTTGQRVNSQPLCVPKEKGAVGTQKTMTNLVPVDRREKRGSRQKISRLSVFSPPVLEEQLLGNHWG